MRACRARDPSGDGIARRVRRPRGRPITRPRAGASISPHDRSAIAIRCCNRGRRRSACRRSPRSGPSISCPRSSTRCGAPGRDRRDREAGRAADLREHAGRLRRQRPRPRPHREAVLQPDRVGDLAGAAGRRARDVAAPRGALQRDLSARAALRPHRRAAPAARTSSRSAPEQLRLLERVHLDFVREGARLSRGRASALRRDRRAPRRR